MDADTSLNPGDDYATTPVPLHRRKGLFALTVTFAGYFASAFNLFVGGVVGSQLSFVAAVVATLIGGVVVLAVCTSVAMISYTRGLSTYMVARSSFGRRGQVVPSFAVILTQPGFAALYTASFGVMIHRVWPAVPWWVASSVFVICVTATAIYGFKGLFLLSAIAVPAIVLLMIYGLIQINPTDVFAASPTDPVGFWLVVSFIIGGWIAGGTLAGGDIGRYAQSKRDVFIAPALGYLVGFVFIAIICVALALREGSGDIVNILIGLNLTIPAVLLYFLLIWTTADNILYYVGLALTNIEESLTGVIRVGKNAWVLLGSASILALGVLAHAMGFIAYMTSLVGIISILIPPFAGIIIADYYLLGRIRLSGEVIDRLTVPIRWNAFIAWTIGSLVGYVATRTDFGVPALLSLGVGLVLFPLIERITPTPSISDDDELGAAEGSRV
jgi:cytosine permease